MAHLAFTNAYVSVNSVDLSDHVKSVTIDDQREQLDATTMGASNKVYGKGLGDGTFTIEFLQDFAAGEVYATCQPLIASTTPITVEVRPVNTSPSATNPRISMSALLFTFQPVAGSVGEMLAFTATFQNAANAGITYATS